MLECRATFLNLFVSGQTKQNVSGRQAINQDIRYVCVSAGRSASGNPGSQRSRWERVIYVL